MCFIKNSKEIIFCVKYLKINLVRSNNGFRVFGKEIIHRFRFETNLQSNVTEQTSQRVRVYPNPAENFVKVDVMGFDREVICTTYDSFGRKLETRLITRRNEIETFELSIENLSKGIYFVEITDGLHRGTIRLIKS